MNKKTLSFISILLVAVILGALLGCSISFFIYQVNLYNAGGSHYLCQHYSIGKPQLCLCDNVEDFERLKI